MKRDNTEPMQYELADWFLKFGEDIVHAHDVIGREVRKIRKSRSLPDKEVTYEELCHWIAIVRERLEITRGMTLWNIHDVGYKLATEKEFAYYTMHSVRRTLLLAARTKRLMPNVNRRFVPEAFEEVFVKSGHRVVSLAKDAKRYMIEFNKMIKQEKEKAHGNKS